jgi:plastocyanin
MRSQIAARGGFLALVLACSGCGGGYGGNPSGVTSPTGAPPTINILGDRGAQSFSPNPASGGQDNVVIWRNNDSVIHRIVLNDSALDTGDLAPGASSRAIQLPAGGANYHCSIHPGMIGALRPADGGAPPPCTGVYC